MGMSIGVHGGCSYSTWNNFIKEIEKHGLGIVENYNDENDVRTLKRESVHEVIDAIKKIKGLYEKEKFVIDQLQRELDDQFDITIC